MSGEISILVVNFNGGDVLLETLAAVFEIRSEWFELILADNGSSDGSLRRAKQAFPDIKCLELGANLGFGTANNRAAAEARGEYLLLLNSDARPDPGCLDKLKKRLESRPRAAVAGPRLRYPDGRPQFHWAPTTSVWGETVQKIRNRWEHRPWIHLVRPGRGWYTAACLMVRKAAFDEVGGFDESFFLYFEDVDLCLRLRAAGHALVDVPQAWAVHIKGGSQSGAGAPGIHYREGQLRYYKKHRPRWEQRLIHWKILRSVEDPEHRVRLNQIYNSDLS